MQPTPVIARSSPIPFSITTVNEGRFVDVNAAFERRYGYSRAEVIGRTVGELGIWEDPKDRAVMVAQLQQRGPIRNVITRLRTKSGEVKTMRGRRPALLDFAAKRSSVWPSR